MRWWVKGVIRFRKWVLAATFLFTVLLLTQLTQLRLMIDPDNVLPRDHHFVRTNELIESTFGNKFTVVVTLTAKAGDIYQLDFLNHAKEITDRLAQAPGVIPSHLNGIATENAKVLLMTENGPEPQSLRKLWPQKEKQIPRFKKALHSDPSFKGLLYSEDERTTQIITEFSKIDGGFQAIERNVRQAVEPYQQAVDIRIGGLPIFLAALEDFSARMGFLFPLALLIIGLIHYEAFRTKQALILPLVTALLAVVWAVGFLGLLRQSFDVFNASTPILILAIAAGHAVQILKRYYEEYNHLQVREGHRSSQELNLLAVEEALTKVGPVMVMACTVAALGFFSLVIFEIKTVRTFGLFTGFGVLSSLAIELTFIPALRATLPAPSQREKQREAQKTFWDRLTSLFYKWATEKRKSVYAFFALLVVFFLHGGTKLQVDNSQKGYFSNKLQVKKDDAFINQNMAGTNLIYVLIDGQEKNSILKYEVLQGIEKTQDFLNSQAEVGKTLSFNNVIKRIHQVALGDATKNYKFPQDKSMFKDLMEVILSRSEPKDLAHWLSGDKSKTIIATFIKTDSSDYIESLTRRTKEFAAGVFPANVKVDIGGGAVNGVALNEVLIREKILNIAQILLAVFLVTTVVFRSFVAGFLILVPLFAAVIVNFGVMGWLGIPLQIATALVSAMAVGIGADYGIYMSYRMREELGKGTDEATALHTAFHSAGKATLFVSSAVAGGFGILMLSWGFYIHIWMGFLIATAMLVSSLTALTLFPALIFSWKPRFIFKALRPTHGANRQLPSD